MIKAMGQNEEGRKLFIMGLSRANCSRLLSGMPIRFDGKPYGLDMEIMICAGSDERALAEAILGSADDPRIKEDPNPT